MEKLAKDLLVGDQVQGEDGEWLKVKRVSRGFVRYESGARSILIDHQKGFSQLPADRTVIVK